MSRRPADQARIALLRALFPRIGPHRLVGATSRDWASALFVGSRHRLGIALQGADAAQRADLLARELRETELAIRGGFVADIAVTARLDEPMPLLAIEALTIDEAGL